MAPVVGEPSLPLDVLGEQLAFLCLDDRERLAPLNHVFTRVLLPSVDAHRAKLLAHGVALIAAHRRRLASGGDYNLVWHRADMEEIGARIQLEYLHEHYQRLSQEVDKNLMLDTAAISALRSRIAALEPEAHLASLYCQLSTMEAEELSRRAGEESARPGGEKDRAPEVLSELRKNRVMVTKGHQKMRTAYLRKHDNRVEELTCVESLAWLETKIGQIQRMSNT